MFRLLTLPIVKKEKKLFTTTAFKVQPLKKICLFFLVVCFSGSIWGNISRSFSESIPFVASGNYIYDDADFVTTPFLYHLQKQNSLSLKFTRDRRAGMFAAGRFSIVNWPVYWAVDLSHSSSQASSEPQVPEVSTRPVNDIERPDYRFMLGADLWGFGFAAYAVISNAKQTQLIRNTAGVSEQVIYNGEVDTVGNLYQPRGNRYGIEFGQSNLPVPLAWTLNLEYRRTGGKGFFQQGSGEADEAPTIRNSDGAPSTIFADGLIPNFNSRIGAFTSTNGNNRQEFRSNFLSWYTLIQKKLNIGLSYALMIPFGSGRNSDLFLPMRQVPKA